MQKLLLGIHSRSGILRKRLSSGAWVARGGARGPTANTYSVPLCHEHGGNGASDRGRHVLCVFKEGRIGGKVRFRQRRFLSRSVQMERNCATLSRKANSRHRSAESACSFAFSLSFALARGREAERSMPTELPSTKGSAKKAAVACEPLRPGVQVPLIAAAAFLSSRAAASEESRATNSATIAVRVSCPERRTRDIGRKTRIVIPAIEVRCPVPQLDRNIW